MEHASVIDNDGWGDVQRAAENLAGRLPAALGPLARLAFNYRWSWTPGGRELFASVDERRFELCIQNPVRLLQEASPEALWRAAEDERLVARAIELEALVAADLNRPFIESPYDARHPVAFLCAEYAIHVSLPVYSGGLGALAGDLLKEASDQAVPMVAVGLMYRNGYFRQRVDAHGWQHEYWVDTDPERLPVALVTGADRSPLTVTVPIGHGDVRARVWRVQVGRVPLLLLDTDCPENAPLDRWITGRLYDGDPLTRLAQYALLGIGGVRALRALGYEPGVIHLNEGHAALAPLELARDGNGDSLEHALARARVRTVFTTHTPVPAGNDSYPPDQIEAVVGRFALELGASPRELIDLGRGPTDEPWSPFGVTQAALRMSRASNAVSRRHEAVARECGAGCGPGAKSTRSRSATSPTACTSRPGSGNRCASCSTAILAPTGPRRPPTPPPGRRSTRSPVTSCGRPAAASAPGWSATSPERSVSDRLLRGAARLCRCRGAGVRSLGADDRIRAPGRDLQAAGPALPRPGVDAVAAERRPAGPGGPGGQGPPA